MKTTTKLWIGIVILAILSPLGLLLPEHFKAGGAWGEWGVDKLQKLVGYVPKGLAKLSSLWKAPVPDYVFNGSEGKSLSHLSLAYIVSALIGIVLVVIVTLIIGRFLSNKNPR